MVSSFIGARVDCAVTNVKREKRRDAQRPLRLRAQQTPAHSRADAIAANKTASRGALTTFFGQHLLSRGLTD
jgi:hypothetical protein